MCGVDARSGCGRMPGRADARAARKSTQRLWAWSAAAGQPLPWPLTRLGVGPPVCVVLSLQSFRFVTSERASFPARRLSCGARGRAGQEHGGTHDRF